MIQHYKKVAIVWGTSVKKDADACKAYLDKLHFEGRFPLEAHIVGDAIIKPELNHEVRDLIKGSDYCIVMLSLDDFGCRESDFESEKEKALKKRIRQNVILEMGMALNQFNGQNYCIFSNYAKEKEKEAEIPSDIEGLTPNRYEENQFPQKLEDLGAALKDTFSLEPNRHLLSQPKIVLDYQKDLFEDTSFYPRNTENLAQEIFKNWISTASTFTFPSEKIVYILERIKFLTTFGRDEDNNVTPIKKLADQFDAVTNKEDDEDPELVDWALKLTSVCLDYTAHRMSLKTQDKKDGYKKAQKSLHDLYQRYLDLKKRLTISPLLEVVLFDFLGLAEGTMAVKFHEGDPFYALERYKDAQKVIVPEEDGRKGDPRIEDGNKTWDGYVNLDLARQAERCLREKEDAELRSLMEKNFDDAITDRAHWKDCSNYPIFFRQALSFEYFRAKRHQLKAYYDHQVDGQDKKGLLEAGHDLLEEINDYALEQMKRLEGEKEALEDYLNNPDEADSFYY